MFSSFLLDHVLLVKGHVIELLVDLLGDVREEAIYRSVL